MPDMITRVIEGRLPSTEVFRRLKKHRVVVIGAAIILAGMVTVHRTDRRRGC